MEIERKFLVTLKYPSVSNEILMRDEFEYEIPAADVRAQMAQASGSIIRKTRHHVKGPDDHLWEVDEFASPIDDLTLAEIELTAADEIFARPSWLGEEVTKNPAYSNLSLSFNKSFEF